MPSKERAPSHDKSTPKQRPPWHTAQTFEAVDWLHQPETTVQRAAQAPRSLTPQDVSRLQRAYGNRAVLQLPGVGGAGMVHAGSERPVQRQEEEEEPLQAMALQRQVPEEEEEPLQAMALQRQVPEEEEEPLQAMALQRQLPEEEEEIQAMPDVQRVGLEGGPVPPEAEAAIARARGGGQPLDGAVQAQMGETMGYDFSGVRVHTDAGADKLNKQLSAKAFTTGSDIFFKRGAYEPGSSGGRELIAHELSHVVQQDTGQVSGGGSGMTVRPAGDSFEQVAEGQRQQAGRQRAVVNPILAFADPTMALRRRYGNEPPTRQVARRGPERLAETKVQPAAHQDAVRSGRLKYRFVLRSRNQAVVQRQLATRVGQIPAAPVFCHPAVWIWAGLEAQGGVHPVNHQNTLQSIVLARPSAQERMLDVPRQKDWRFLWLRQKRTDLTQNMPPDGTVLLWDQGATHSAVAVNGRIAGYNNRAIVPTPLPNPAGVDGNLNGFSRITPDNLNPDWHVCRTISEATIVRIARRLIQRGPFVW